MKKRPASIPSNNENKMEQKIGTEEKLAAHFFWMILRVAIRKEVVLTGAKRSAIKTKIAQQVHQCPEHMRDAFRLLIRSSNQPEHAHFMQVFLNVFLSPFNHLYKK